jgi:hypothetical protein
VHEEINVEDDLTADEAKEEGIDGTVGAPGVRLTPSGGWEKRSDGYYYYTANNGVFDGQSLTFGLTLSVDGNWSGTYGVRIEAQALQAPNTDPNWPELT